MDKFLFALIMTTLAFTARADTVLVQPNQSGGTINLTDETSNCAPPSLLAIAIGPDGTTTGGCWQGRDNYTRIQVLWIGGKYYVYKTDDFAETAYSLHKRGVKL